MESAINENNLSFLEKIIGYQEWTNDVQKPLEGYPNPMCSKPIYSNEIIWKCYDCTGDQDVICLCNSCFLKGNHKGHRVFFYHKKSDEAVCDCADTSQPYIFYCDDHKEDFKVDPNELISKIQPKFAQNLKNFVINFYQDSFYQLDEIQKTPDSDSELIQEINKNLSKFHDFLLFLIKDRLPLIYFISDIVILPTNKYLLHQCNNYDKVQQQLSEPIICKCPILNNLFRYSYLIRKETQMKISEILKIMLFNADYKAQFSKAYCDMFDFLTYKQNDKAPFISLYCQFFSTNSQIEIMTNSNFRKYACGGFKKVLQDLHSSNDFMNLIDIWQAYFGTIHFQFAHPQIASIWIDYGIELLEAYMNKIIILNRQIQSLYIFFINQIIETYRSDSFVKDS